jgi:hypothetical protein
MKSTWADAYSRIAKIAEGLDDPQRMAEVRQHFEAVNGALNNSHVGGQQDSLCVFEAMGLMLAQLTGALSQQERESLLTYTIVRADMLASEFRKAGKAAAHLIEV